MPNPDTEQDDHAMQHPPPKPRFFEESPIEGQEIIILMASPSLRDGPGSPLVCLVREFMPYWLRCDPQPIICAVEGSYRAIKHSGLLHHYPNFRCLPPGFRGGVVYVNDIVINYKPRKPGDLAFQDPYPVRVFYLIDPTDPTSIYPETVALKRDCVVAGKTFLATPYGSMEWLTIQWYANCDPSSEAPLKRRLIPQEMIDRVLKQSGHAAARSPNIAFVAHDSKKAELLDFALSHYDYFA